MPSDLQRTALIPHDVLAQLLELSRRHDRPSDRVAHLGTVLVTVFITFSACLMLRMLAAG